MAGLPLGLDPTRMAADVRTAARGTLCRYGCRHAVYTDREVLKRSVHGAYFNAPEVGWISMNETRDLAAMYAGVDMLDMVSRYWDWQATVNAREYVLFLDTFYGNSLMFYSRGLAAFGTSTRRSASIRTSPKTGAVCAAARGDVGAAPADADWQAGRPGRGDGAFRRQNRLQRVGGFCFKPAGCSNRERFC